MANKIADHFFEPWKIKDDGTTNLDEEALSDPMKWEDEICKKNIFERVFCGDKIDIFKDNSDEQKNLREKIFEIVDHTPHLYWMFVSESPQNFFRLLPQKWLNKPTKNVWLGTKMSKKEDIERIKHLKDIPAALRFAILEPEEKINIRDHLIPFMHRSQCAVCGYTDTLDIWKQLIFKCPKCGANKWGYPKHLHWVIVREKEGSDPKWSESIKDQCDTSRTIFFLERLEKAKVGELNYKDTPDFLFKMTGVI